MKKELLVLFVLVGVCSGLKAQDVYFSNNGTVSFSSHAPLEDIYAESEELSSAINIKTNKVSAKVKIKTLKMENSLQQEHLNEKYLESHKFPTASFAGEIIDEVKWSEDGVYNVKVKGNLVVHGIGRERTIDVVITIKDGKISSYTKFKVKVEDHNVEVPKLVIKKVAEEVEIEMKSEYKIFVPEKK